MAPEQMQGESVTPSADIYSLGLVIYEMVTGKRAFESENPFKVAIRKATESPPSLREHAPGLGEQWEVTVRRCTQNEPKLRPGAREVLTQLQPASLSTRMLPEASVIEGPEVDGARPAMVEPQPGKESPPWSRPTLLLGVAGVLLVVSAFATGSAPDRGAIRDRLCDWWPGTALFCVVPADKHLTVVPFEITARDPDDRVFAQGLYESIVAKLGHLVPFDAGLCVHPRDDGNLFGLRLLLTGTIEHEGDKIRIRSELQESRDFEPVRSLRCFDRLIGVDDAAQFQDGLTNGLIDLLDIDLPTDALPRSLAVATLRPKAYGAYLRGVGHLKNGKIGDAETEFTQALDADYSFALAHIGLGDTFRTRYDRTKEPGWAARARDEYRYASDFDGRLNPDDLDGRLEAVYCGLGQLERSLGETEKAIGAFGEALKVNQRSFETHRKLADAYEALDRYEDSENALRRLVENLPNCWYARNRLGIYYGYHARYEDSEREFAEVIKSAPDNPMAFNNLAATLLRRGRYEEAVSRSRKSLELSPNSDAYRTLGRALYLQGKYKEAAAELEHALALAPKDYRARSYLGEAYLEVPGEQLAAARHFGQAATDAHERMPKRPNDYRPHVWLALSAAHLGDRAEARREIGVALDIAKKRGIPGL